MFKKINMELDSVFDNLSFGLQEHGRRVGELMSVAARENNELMKYYHFNHESELNSALFDAGQYHDIGKILYSPVLLGKESTLNALQDISNAQHPICSAKILEKFGKNLWQSTAHENLVMDSVLYHHEQCNGKGYPNGLKDNQIPLTARLCSAMNGLDHIAINKNRTASTSVEEAVFYAVSLMKTVYDKKIVDLILTAQDNLVSFYSDEKHKNNIYITAT